MAEHGRLRDAHIAGKLGLVNDISQPQTDSSHQPPEIDKRRHRGEILQVALQICFCISGEPRCSVPLVLHLQRWNGIAAPPRKLFPAVLLRRLIPNEVSPSISWKRE